MPSTIERPPAAHVVAHATEYPPDRERREGRNFGEEGTESHAERPDEPSCLTDEESEAVLIDHVTADHCLDGVTAYTHLGEQALLHLQGASETPGEAPEPSHLPERHLEHEVRHAYEDHPVGPETHRINVAT